MYNIYIYIYIYICIYTHTYTCMCIYIYIYILNHYIIIKRPQGGDRPRPVRRRRGRGTQKEITKETAENGKLTEVTNTD